MKTEQTQPILDIPEEENVVHADNSVIPDDWIIEMLEGNQPDFWWVY